jgi:hypothetical protein
MWLWSREQDRQDLRDRRDLSLLRDVHEERVPRDFSTNRHERVK